MSSRPETRKDPLAPVEVVVTCLSACLAVLFALTVPLAIFSNGSVFGIGEREACVAVSTDAVPFGDSDGPGGFFVPGLRPGARFFPERLSVCDTDPNLGVKAAAVSGGAAGMLVLVGFLALTWRLVRQARRGGLFTTSVAAHARTIGWFVVVGAMLAELVRSLGNGVVVSSAVAGVRWSDGLERYDMPWTLVIVGVAVLTFSRVLRQAVELQDEVDATI